jgi:hypothetical protein
MAVMEPLNLAREAFAARRWDVAYAAYRSCDGLTGDDLDALAEAAHWLGRPDESIVTYTEAYRLHHETPDIESEATRLEAHGATRLQPDVRSEHGSTWILMSDPEGNAFCVCDAGAGSGHLS